MPVPKMRNFSEASQYDPKEMLGQIEQTMRDKNAFSAMSLENKVELLEDYMYFNNVMQHFGGNHDRNRFWDVRGNRIFESMARTIAQNIPDGEDCMEELRQPSIQRTVIPRSMWTQEMYEARFSVTDYENKLRQGKLGEIREERIKVENEKRARQERDEREARERQEREEREARERREQEEQRKKEEAAQKLKEEQEAKEREEQRKKEEAEKKLKEEQEAKELEEQRKKDEAARKEREEQQKIENENKLREEKERQERLAREAKEREEARKAEEKRAEEARAKEQKAIEEDKAQARKDIAELGEKIKNGDLGADSYERREVMRKYLTAKTIDQEGYKPSMKDQIRREIFRSRELMDEMNRILESPITGEERLNLLNSEYIQKLAQKGTLTELSTRKGRKELAESREKYENDFPKKKSDSLDRMEEVAEKRDSLERMEAAAQKAFTDGNAAKRNVYFGSAQYDEAVDAMDKVREVCQELKAGMGKLSPEEEKKLQDKLVDAEQKIDRYFSRKINRRELTEEGNFTNRTDEKSKRRINVLKEAKQSISQLRNSLQLDKPEDILEGGVRDISFNEMINKNQKSGGTVKKGAKAKHTSVKTSNKGQLQQDPLKKNSYRRGPY